MFRRTPNLSPEFIQSHKHFLVGLYTGKGKVKGGERGAGGVGLILGVDLYMEPILCLELFTPVICILRKRNGIR